MNWRDYKNIVVDLVKRILFRFVSKKWLASLGGWWGWVASFAFDYVFKYFKILVLEPISRTLHGAYAKWKAKKAIKDVKNAKDDKDFDDSVNRLP